LNLRYSRSMLQVTCVKLPNIALVLVLRAIVKQNSTITSSAL